MLKHSYKQITLDTQGTHKELFLYIFHVFPSYSCLLITILFVLKGKVIANVENQG